MTSRVGRPAEIESASVTWHDIFDKWAITEAHCNLGSPLVWHICKVRWRSRDVDVTSELWQLGVIYLKLCQYTNGAWWPETKLQLQRTTESVVEAAAQQERLQLLLESLSRWCRSDVKWQTVSDVRRSSSKSPIANSGQPRWRYDDCRCWWGQREKYVCFRYYT